MIYCGIDGGQTSTKSVLGTESGELIGAGSGGPLIHLSAKDGASRFVASISEAIDNAWQEANRPPSAIQSIVVGATGIFEDTIEASKAADLLSSIYPHSSVYVCSDAQIALVGAHAGASGIMVISGTGTIAYGINQDADRDAKLERAGGWGWPLGDEGSAFAIGRAGLRAALYAGDGLGPETQLLPLTMDHFEVDDPHDIKRIYFAPTFGAAAFAALAPLVSKAAEQYDVVAQQIITNQGSALARQAVAVAKKLEFAEGTSISVAPVGGAFQHIVGLTEAMTQALVEQQETVAYQLRIAKPKLSPRVGAYLMALQQANHVATDRIMAAIIKWDV